MEFVNWDHDIPIYEMESHKIPWFQTTNQLMNVDDILDFRFFRKVPTETTRAVILASALHFFMRKVMNSAD